MSTDQINDGGPAFPEIRISMAADGVTPLKKFYFGGMTLRDYFAAKAMAGWLASFGPEGRHPAAVAGGARNLAVDSYAMADAMLEARKQ